VDCFPTTETPGSVRTAYHMLRSRWDALGPDYTRLCDSAGYADEYVEPFTLHYGRTG